MKKEESLRDLECLYRALYFQCNKKKEHDVVCHINYTKVTTACTNLETLECSSWAGTVDKSLVWIACHSDHISS